MLKLGMKPIPGVSRVTVKKSKNVGSLHFDLLMLFNIYTDSASFKFSSLFNMMVLFY